MTLEQLTEIQTLEMRIRIAQLDLKLQQHALRLLEWLDALDLREDDAAYEPHTVWSTDCVI